NRSLLTLATGTGKTAIAFQIAWKLFQARWTLQKNAQRRPRILFLADRNILADQAYNDFASFMAFPEDALVRIRPKEIQKKGYVPKNGSVFFTIFQTFMSGTDAEGNPVPYFGEYPPDFFDCIIIDECHRGGAKDESAWRGILEYFAPALQIGLTATPKRDVNTDTYAYFGDPVYVYSLKSGINDGFLTPFKLRRIATTLDDYTYVSDDIVLEGEVERGQYFRESDFNVTVEIREREEFRVKQFLSEIPPLEKTLVFCANQRHALLIRDIINQKKSVKEPDYCVRVTADDGDLGEEFLRKFQDNEKSIPAILTTSHKLSTGVDARNIRNIVLLRPIRNMIEFKQIIGRGTRLFDGKDYFTIFDFVQAHDLFNDEEWDGEPVAPEPKPDGVDEPAGPDEPEGPEGEPEGPGGDEGGDEGGNGGRPLVRIKLADGKERQLRSIKATSFWGPDGKPMSAKEFLESLYGKLPEFFHDEDELRALWSDPETRKKLLEGLQERGFDLASLKELQRAIDAEKSDLYDVLAYVAFSSPMELREARAEQARQHYPAFCTDPQKAFLDFVLAQYTKEGFTELDSDKLPPLIKGKYGGSITDGLAELGDISGVRGLFVEMQQWLYRPPSL
ncbi:MAG: DEAD/DEAH box helicase family protein, partial [Desulfovibrionaceae bacterium]|nr:DEAD/DEAH box helicase family protein [Desulfovibrionaceae bacterium]